MIAGEEDPFIFISDNRSIVVWDYKQQIMTDRLIDAHDGNSIIFSD